ncbi:MAG: hypothetical protein ACUVRO_10890, partial [Armatimonadota bacterium]
YVSPIAVVLALLALLILSTLAVKAQVLKADSRLDIKVSLAMGNATIESVLKELSQKTGVPIAAGQKSEEWQVREMPVNVFVKDVPAWEVMEHLSKLTDFIWSAVDEGDRKGYRLWQDLKARQAQAEEKDKRLRALQSQRTRKGMQNLEAFARIARATPEELREMAQKDPAAFVVATQPGLKAVPVIVSSLTPEQQLRATTKDGIRLPYKEMPDSLKTAVRDMGTGLMDLVKKLVPQGIPAEMMKEPEWEKTTLIIRAPDYEQVGMIGESIPVTGEVRLEGAGPILEGMGLPIFETSSPIGKLIGQAFSQISEGAPIVNLQVMMQEEFAKIVAKDIAQSTPPSSDPELQKKVKWDVKGWSSMDKELQAFHEASGLNLIADALPQPNMQGPAVGVAMGQEAPIYQILGRFKALFGLEWQKDGSVIRLRDRDWAKKRDWLIPRSLLDRWKAQAKTDEGLRIGELIEMAALTEDQAKYGLLAERDLLYYSFLLNERTRPLLKLLGSLTPQQAKALESGDKLAIDSLSAEQAGYLKQLWSDLHKDLSEDERALPPGTVVYISQPQGQQKDTSPIGKRQTILLRVEKENAVMADGRPVSATFVVSAPKPPPLPGVE